MLFLDEGNTSIWQARGVDKAVHDAVAGWHIGDSWMRSYSVGGKDGLANVVFGGACVSGGVRACMGSSIEECFILRGACKVVWLFLVVDGVGIRVVLFYGQCMHA